jgi:transposase
MGPVVRGFLPADPPRGGRWLNHRLVIDGIFFRTRTGCPWRDLPEGFGIGRPPITGIAAGRWTAPGRRSWTGCGPAAMRPRGRTGRSAPIPPWSARTSTPPVPAGPCPRTWSRGAAPNDKNPAARAVREALGRSRGGLGTKIHLTADRRCRPVSRILSPGQHGDCPQFIPLMQAIRISRRAWAGPAPGPAPRWPTRPTPPLLTAPTCASAGSRRSSR